MMCDRVSNQINLMVHDGITFDKILHVKVGRAE